MTTTPSPTIGRHEVLVYRTLAADVDAWLSSAEVAERAGVAPRTARAHVAKLVDRSVAQRAEVSPGYRYRIAPHDQTGYKAQLHAAAAALGIELPERPGR